MKRMAKVVMVAVVLAALTIGQSGLMAAPVRGAEMAATRSHRSGFFSHIFSILAAVWSGGHAAVWSGDGATFGTDAAVWSGGK